MTINVTDTLMDLHAELEPYAREHRRWRRIDKGLNWLVLLGGFANIGAIWVQLGQVPVGRFNLGSWLVVALLVVSMYAGKRRRQAHDRMMAKHSEVMEREIRKYKRGDWPVRVTTLEDK